MKVKCTFSDDKWYLGNDERVQYTCSISELTITEPGTKITDFIGEHLQGRYYNDVTAININKCTVNYFPRGLIEIFPSLKALQIRGCGLKEVSREDLIGLENLEDLSLHENKLYSLPSDLFVGMNQLKEISFDQNKLEFLSSKLLKPILGNGLVKVDFRDNTNINAFFEPENEDSVGLHELMVIIDENCKPSKEIQMNIYAEGIEELWTSKEFSDFIIIGGGEFKEFAVHKNLLATQSRVFAAVFKNDMKEKQTGKMKVDDFEADVVEGMLEFMYTGEVKDERNAMDLFAIAAQYEVKLLKNISEKIILCNVNESNAIEVFGLASLHNSSVLKLAAFENILKMFPHREMNESMIENPEKMKIIVEAARKVQEGTVKIREAQAEVDAMLQQ